MMQRWFGTDGIRAPFGEEPLTRETIRRIGLALGRSLVSAERPEPLVLLGGDTRASSPALLGWLSEGLGAAGARTLDLGTLPTPAVAWAVPRYGAAAGVVASASHNPAADNGIKLIDEAGFKWSEAAESAFEARLAETESPKEPGAPGASDGRRADAPEAGERYLHWLVGEAGGRHALDGLRVVLDTANGAASRFAGELFVRLGATVELLFAAPDGGNINRDCGSTHPAAIAARIAAGRGTFDVGFAFDGDADRALLLDERGQVHDGDAMLFLWARSLHQRGELTVPQIVATSMSNLGLDQALAAIGVGVVRCDVGDRAVVATLHSHGLRLGGEQSGHLVDLHRSTTGDGLLTAVQLATIAARAARQGEPLSTALADFRRLPQVLLNVRVTRKPSLELLPGVATATRRVEEQLGSGGRLVLRYSGTEPLARIMIEGPDAETIRELAEELADALRGEIGASA
jgi:phosphoglucosamine mutase